MRHAAAAALRLPVAVGNVVDSATAACVPCVECRWATETCLVFAISLNHPAIMPRGNLLMHALATGPAQGHRLVAVMAHSSACTPNACIARPDTCLPIVASVWVHVPRQAACVPCSRGFWHCHYCSLPWPAGRATCVGATCRSWMSRVTSRARPKCSGGPWTAAALAGAWSVTAAACTPQKQQTLLPAESEQQQYRQQAARRGAARELVNL